MLFFQNLESQNAGLADDKKDLNFKKSKGNFVREKLKQEGPESLT